MPASAPVPGYSGSRLPASTESLLAILEGHGFSPVATTQYAGKTINLVREQKRFGYINPTVLAFGAVVGYNFAAWGHPYNACPASLVETLPEAFCQRYKCSLPDIVVHQGTGSNSKHAFLLIRSPSVALRVLLHESGATPDEDLVLVAREGTYIEGAVRDVVMRVHERSASAREACLSHYGYSCHVCKTRLRERYQGLALDLIHVHHEVPIASKQAVSEVDPVADMKPVCPNCHAVIHSRTPPYTIEEAKAMLRE